MTSSLESIVCYFSEEEEAAKFLQLQILGGGPSGCAQQLLLRSFAEGKILAFLLLLFGNFEASRLPWGRRRALGMYRAWFEYVLSIYGSSSLCTW